MSAHSGLRAISSPKYYKQRVLGSPKLRNRLSFTVCLTKIQRSAQHRRRYTTEHLLDVDTAVLSNLQAHAVLDASSSFTTQHKENE